MEQAGMGVGIGDYNLDGNLDIFKTHFTDDTSILYRNDGKGNFTDATISAGLGVETRYVGWGAGIVDLDNDGLPDLFLVTGNVYSNIEDKLSSYPYRTPRVVFRNLGGGKFEELIEQAGPGIAAAHSSRGCAFAAFDNDGAIDGMRVNLTGPLLAIAGILRAQAPCTVTPPTATMTVKRGSGRGELSADPQSPEWRNAVSAWIVKDCSRTLDYPNLKTEVKGFWTDTDLHLLF